MSAEPTTKAERAELLKRRGKHTGRLLYGPKTMMGRLCADVKRLDTESRAFAEDVLSLSASLGKKIERVSELEAERDGLREAAKRAYDDKCYCDSHHGGDDWECAHAIIEEALIQDGYIVTVAKPYQHHHVGDRPCTICSKELSDG